MKRNNKRKKKRGYKNLFWLGESAIIGSNEVVLYNQKPYRTEACFGWHSPEYYKDGWTWFSLHGKSYPERRLHNKFPTLDYETLIPVELVIDNDNPDMFIQRVRDNLFISCGILDYDGGKKKLWYPSRISPKLFPEVTEESGIVGVRIDEKKEKEI